MSLHFQYFYKRLKLFEKQFPEWESKITQALILPVSACFKAENVLKEWEHQDGDIANECELKALQSPNFPKSFILNTWGAVDS